MDDDDDDSWDCDGTVVVVDMRKENADVSPCFTVESAMPPPTMSASEEESLGSSIMVVTAAAAAEASSLVVLVVVVVEVGEGIKKENPDNDSEEP